MPRLLIAIPDLDFDPTEAATPWFDLTHLAHTWHGARSRRIQATFATPDGRPGVCDPKLLSGVIFGMLGADATARARYAEMTADPAFQAPLAYDAVDPEAFDALLLPGGHAKGIKPYLESEVLRRHVLAFVKAGKPVGAICHGVIVLARTIDPETGKSVLHDRRVTALLKVLELGGWLLTAWKLGDYYRTYPTPVEDEVRAALRHSTQFSPGLWPWWPHVVRDGNLVTGRWPADAERLAWTFLDVIEAAPSTDAAPVTT